MQIGEAAVWRERAHAVSGMAGKLLFDLKDAETNQRDYLLTGDEASLGRYLEAQNII
ncbi:MAG: CHASE3 domain, partial [Deltaproteobacteria bacterium]|nr:CHASE3 domain [Deltaproteobacteria bacterium]